MNTNSFTLEPNRYIQWMGVIDRDEVISGHGDLWEDLGLSFPGSDENQICREIVTFCNSGGRWSRGVFWHFLIVKLLHFGENLLWACFDGSEILSSGAFGGKFEQLAKAGHCSKNTKWKLHSRQKITTATVPPTAKYTKWKLHSRRRKRTTVGTDIAAKNEKWHTSKKSRCSWSLNFAIFWGFSAKF